MENEIFVVVKEYTTYVEGLDHQVHGKVYEKHVKTGSSDFMYSVSHYCKGTASAGSAYIPSAQLVDTLSLAETLLLAYMKSFKNLGVIENKFF